MAGRYAGPAATKARVTSRPALTYCLEHDLVRKPVPLFGIMLFAWSMILSENRCPPRIKSGAGFFGIMLLQ